MSNRLFTSLGLIVALGLPAVTLTACGSDDGRTVVKTESTSRGQQLIDLQRAYENGAISRKEYEREREKILKEK
jgi:hypothetical protein